MGRYRSLWIIILAALAQATFAPQMALLGGRPDFVFLAALCWSLYAGLEDGVLWAFIGGLLVDLLSAAPTGTSVPGILLALFAVDAIQRQVYRIGLVPLVGLTLVGTLVQQMLLLLLLTLFGLATFSLDAVSYVMLPTALYNLVLVLPVYWILGRFSRRGTRGLRSVA